jgi:hypothetical protein
MAQRTSVSRVWTRFWSEAPAEPRGGDPWLCALALALAAVSLGYALELSNGTLMPLALALVSAALLSCGVAVATPRLAIVERWGEGPLLWVLGAGIFFQIALQFATPPGLYVRADAGGQAWHQLGLAAAALLAGVQLAASGRLGRASFLLLLGVHFALGLWMLRASPAPAIDVWLWHQAAFEALARGASPWGTSIPNIYGHTRFYAEGLATPDAVDVGFPYLPLTLIVSALGDAAGDYRCANALAYTATGALMGLARPSRLARAAATLFLTTPRGLFVLEQGWSEPHVVLAFAALVFLGARSAALLRLAWAALLAAKQYCLFALPLVWLLVRPGRRFAREAAVAGALAAALTLPFALWDPSGFLESAVLFHLRQPFRADGLGFLAWTAQDGQPTLPLWLGFGLLPLPLALGLWRAPRTPAGFAAASALSYGLFFAFGKQAFCNYYFLVLGMVCAALAAADLPAGAAGERSHQARNCGSRQRKTRPGSSSTSTGSRFQRSEAAESAPGALTHTLAARSKTPAARRRRPPPGVRARDARAHAASRISHGSAPAPKRAP